MVVVSRGSSVVLWPRGGPGGGISPWLIGKNGGGGP